MWKKIYRAKSGDPMVPGFHENILLVKEDKEGFEVIKLDGKFSHIQALVVKDPKKIKILAEQASQYFKQNPRNLVNLFTALFFHPDYYFYETDRTGMIKYGNSIVNLYNEKIEKIIDLRTPWRSPKACVETIKDIIEDKSVHHIGCGFGDLMIFMKEYGSKISGVELNEKRIERCLEKKLDAKQGNALNYDIPECDVYYIWMDDSSLHMQIIERIIKKYKRKKIVIRCDTSHNPDVKETKKILNVYPGEIRYSPFWEGSYDRESGDSLMIIIES